MRYHHVDVFTDRPYSGGLAVFPDAGPLTGAQMRTITQELRHFESVDAPLTRLGAEFAYLLDASAMEGRHWNNDGILEDVATGSGAGCAAAYLRSHGRIGAGERRLLRQGRFTGRPSAMTVSADGHGRDIRSVRVGGGVALVGEGRLRELPPS
ncbi:PhzF family phenazine biosynthesis protein [Streptomyces nojiriensis]|uniref:PhzF family phenazine biosynthesis protein n=1 Tax=Streptomyces nojiriensis TaxID=66374 RepID=UPI00367F75CC